MDKIGMGHIKNINMQTVLFSYLMLQIKKVLLIYKDGMENVHTTIIKFPIG